MRPCLLCDADRCELRRYEAFALGVGAAIARTSPDRHENAHRVTEMMCSEHRVAYVMAMATIAVALNRIPDTDPAPEDLREGTTTRIPGVGDV